MRTLTTRLLALALALATLLLMGGACAFASEQPAQSEPWSYERTFAQSLTAMAGSGEVTLGDLNTLGMKVIIPDGAFAQLTEVTLSIPEQVPDFNNAEMTGFDAPFSLSAGDSPIRLLQPVTVTVRYDPDALGADLENGSLYFCYFNGAEWDYVKAEVDNEQRTMTFTTSHFCLFGKAKLTIAERIERYTGNIALAKWSQKKTNKMIDQALGSVIDDVLFNKLDIQDNSIKGQILGSLLKDDEWGGMMEGIADKDLLDFNGNFQILLGKVIVNNVPAETLSKALGMLTDDDNKEFVEQAAQAAGYLAEGRSADAAKIIGNAIADRFLITKLGKVAVEAVDTMIKTWSNEEIEAAYSVYVNGADSTVPWWGYQVDAGNFEQVWEQMGGAARQVEIDALTAQRRALEEAGMPPMTQEEEEKVRNLARENLKTMFEQRRESEAEIAAMNAEYNMVINGFREVGLLEKGSFGWDGGYELEQRLDLLTHFMEKLLRDTGRDSIIDGAFHNDKAITLNQLKSAAMGWFGTGDPQERIRLYEEFLKTQYGISQTQNLSYVSGDCETIPEYALHSVFSNAGAIQVQADGSFGFAADSITTSVGIITAITVSDFQMSGRIDTLTGKGNCDFSYQIDFTYSNLDTFNSNGLYQLWEATTNYSFTDAVSGTAVLDLQGDTLAMAESLNASRTGQSVVVDHYVYFGGSESYSDPVYSYEGVYDCTYASSGNYRFAVSR